MMQQLATLLLQHREGHPLEGIIAYLTKQCGGNVHHKGLVTCTSSSIVEQYRADHGYPWNAVDFSQETLFHSQPEIEPWLSYDLKDKRIFVTGYSIRSRNDHTTGHPRTWDLEGSNDNKSWVRLDQHKNDQHFTQTNVAHYFTVRPYCQRFRYLRIRHWGPAHGESASWLVLSALEFFGDITDRGE